MGKTYLVKESRLNVTSGLMSTLYRTPPRLVVGQIFGADNLSWRFYGNVLRGNSLHESFNHSGLSP